ncbi:MAG: anti-sigma regulatory factor [Acidobacteria bacterium]|nr:anti-sigma regulatory factor [Acidobacteriota bacterium]
MTGRLSEPLRVRLPVSEELDVVLARTCGRELALQQGFREAATGAIATAISEVARNIIVHAGTGEIVLEVVEGRGRRELVVLARDRGPGIPDLHRAMEDGYSTAGGLGLGLSSARRLMDEFGVVSTVGKGTMVTMKKWAA